MTPIDVLFLCETNAATSVMAEAILNARADLQIRAFSAGRAPAARLLPEAIAALSARAIPTDGLQPKSCSIFAFPGAPRPNLIVDLATVTWTNPDFLQISGGAVLRWPLRDPALIAGPRERRTVADAVLGVLLARIEDELIGRRLGARTAFETRGSRPGALVVA